MPPADAKVFRDHRHLPWLRHVAVGRPGRVLPRRLEAEPTERRPRSDGAGVQRRRAVPALPPAPWARICCGSGCLYTRVESRLLPRMPTLSKELAGFRNKVFRSDTLAEADISNLYSEIVGLDL